MLTLLENKPAMIGIPPKVTFLFMAGFKDVEGCIFLRPLFNGNSLDALAIHHDRTGYEAAVNKIFIEDYLEPDDARELPALAATSVGCAHDLVARLRKAYPGMHFNVVLSVSNTGLRIRKTTAALRFFVVRPNEAWLAPNIEGYSEAIAVFET